MVLTETVFHRGKAVGQMLQNTNTGRVTFQPKEGLERLAKRKWANVKACRKAVTNYYRKEQGNE